MSELGVVYGYEAAFGPQVLELELSMPTTMHFLHRDCRYPELGVFLGYEPPFVPQALELELVVRTTMHVLRSFRLPRSTC